METPFTADGSVLALECMTRRPRFSSDRALFVVRDLFVVYLGAVDVVGAPDPRRHGAENLELVLLGRRSRQDSTTRSAGATTSQPSPAATTSGWVIRRLVFDRTRGCMKSLDPSDPVRQTTTDDREP